VNVAVYEASGAVACNQTNNVLLKLLHFVTKSKQTQFKSKLPNLAAAQAVWAWLLASAHVDAAVCVTQQRAQLGRIHAACSMLAAVCIHHMLSWRGWLEADQQQQLSHGRIQVQYVTHMQSKSSKQTQEQDAKPACHPGITTGVWEAFYTHRFHYCQIMRAIAFFT